MATLAALASGCGTQAAAPKAPQPVANTGALSVFAEGPCPTLAVAAAGKRRFVVFGDHGREFGGWLPGEAIAAAQSLVELRGGEAFRRPELLEGLPTDARGYVRGAIDLGGSAHAPWLVRTTTRYSKDKRGPLFERESNGYLFDSGWQPTTQPVTIPPRARRLPELPIDSACGTGLRWVPLAWTPTPKGGLVVAGRCDDARAANLLHTKIMVAHGQPDATSWTLSALPETDVLDGIINLDVYAPAEDNVYVSAYEPYKEPDKRLSYLAHYDGQRWRDLPLDIADGIMAISGDGAGTLWLAAGRAAYVLRKRRVEPVVLPPLRFVAGAKQPELHIHDVHYLDGELWIEASYRVELPGQRGAHWASALFSTRTASAPLFCDARETAPSALVVAESRAAR